MQIIDKDLGEIRLTKNSRARRITVRYREGIYHLTHPSHVSLTFIEDTIGEMKERLLKLKEKTPDIYIFTPDKVFKTHSFTVQVAENNCANYYVQLKDGILTISCPQYTDFQKEEVQATIRDNIEKALRYEAKRLFPAMVKELAEKHGFQFSGVKVNKSRTRWGSCSSKKSINLSYYCLLLPTHLLELIILHELCHTVEMNHGERFWLLMDKVTNGQSRRLTKELKAYRTLL